MLQKQEMEEVLSILLEAGGDFGELFFEDTRSAEMSMIDGKLEKVNSGRICGIGLRAFLNTNAVYAYTNDLSIENLKGTARRIGKALKGLPKPQEPFILNEKHYETKLLVLLPFEIIEKREKKHVMQMANEGARTYAPSGSALADLIGQIEVSYLEKDQYVRIANTDGMLTEDRRRRTRLTTRVIAAENGQKETGSSSPGYGTGFEFYNLIDPREVGQEAARIALRMIRADYAPAGMMPVVIGNGFGGVIFHEACGHSLEATSVAKGASVFCGKVGQKIANDCVNAVDDGTIPNAWGTSTVDDEGTPTQRNQLIENGILKGYLVDRLNARKMGANPTGSGRRENYTYAPTSRMSNTFLMPGQSIPEEIIANTERGLYAKTMGGGSVQPTTGEFNFAVLEGYLIEKGRVVKPVRGATLIGKGHEVLEKIDMIGNDLTRSQGMCGSISGSIPADVGQPTIRVSELLVGGRNT